MKKLLYIYLVFHVFGLLVFGQGEIDSQKKIFYRNERSASFMLNSNGWGLNYRYGKRTNAFVKNIYDVDFAVLKDSKEVKLSAFGPGSFVYGKLNDCYVIRPGLGIQKEIYRKVDKGGIAIRYFYTGGPSACLLKPVYYEVAYLVSGSTTYNLKEEKFSTGSNQQSPDDIYGPASYFKGFNELSLVPGIFGKIGLNFEYSNKDIILHAIEVGAIIDAFAKQIHIMADTKNNQLFLTLFVSYRFGKVIDANPAKQSKDKKGQEW
jgi:hypothetical protein